MAAKVRRQIILLSILLHILFLASWESLVTIDVYRPLPAAPPAEDKNAPLVFDLARPELPREVIATPADAKTADQPKKADFLSDKNALSRNQEPAPALRRDDNPFAQGDFASHDLPPRPSGPDKAVAEPAKDLAEANQEQGDKETPGSSRSRITATAPVNKMPFQPSMPGVRHDHRDSQADDSGGLSFNTYNWDFAPYMLELKERIRRNIFPPLAFSELGMIDGDTLLRFKIYPNGELRDLELLAYDGHRSLMQTSTNAIRISAPFRKLPGNFPEPYLEVTAKFTFFIKNKRG